MNRASVGVISLQKTSCYFCSKWLNEENIKDHLTTCGEVLEACSNNCKAFIQRKNMEKHLLKCAKSYEDIDNNDNISNRLSLIEQNINLIKKQLSEKIDMNYQFHNDIGEFTLGNQIVDEWMKKTNNKLNILQIDLNIEIQERNFELNKLKESFEELSTYGDTIKLFKEDTENSLSCLEDKLQLKCSDEAIENRLNEIEADIKTLKFQSTEDVNDCVKYIATINDRLGKCESYLDQQFQKYDMFYIALEKRIENSENDIKTLENMLSKLLDTLNTTNYNVKQITNITHEIEDKFEKFEKMYEEKKIMMIQRDFLTNENTAIVQNSMNNLINTRGHLMWRIENYSYKKLEAKENGTVLKSDLFSNKPYGYVLQMNVYMNGLGTWQNRNIIICLKVCNGNFDTLLPWPCNLNADIVLRDQPYELDKAKNIFKSVVAKKQGEIEQNNQYIHIPHSIIEATNSTYLRDDSIILEVRVNK